MKTKTHFHKLSRIIILSVLHALIGVYILRVHAAFSIAGVLLGLLNLGLLLHYFTMGIQVLLAYRLSRKTQKDPYVWFIFILGIVINALLIYFFFLLIFGYSRRIIELFT